MRLNNKTFFLLISFLLAFLYGCSVAKYIPEGELFYAGVQKIRYEDKGEGYPNNSKQARKDVEDVLNYKPNNSLLSSASARLPITYPFYINKHFAQSKSFIGRWLYKNLGESPRLISDANPSLRANVAKQILEEYGYFNSSVTPEVIIQRNDSVSAKIAYQISMGQPHLLDSIEYQIFSIPLAHLQEFCSKEHSLLQKGEPFGVLILENERTRISEHLRQNGYYFFQPNNIIYEADTIQVPNRVQLRVQLSDKMLPEAYKPWRIGSITFNIRDGVNSPLTDSLMIGNILYRYHQKPPVKLSVLTPRTKISVDSLYSNLDQMNTLRAMAELNTFAYTDIAYEVSKDSMDNRLNVIINSQLDKPYSTELEGLFRFKSNNQVGPGVNLSVNRKNIFRGGELLTITARGSYEWETKRTQKGNSWDINSYEFGLTAALTFPRLLLPFIKNNIPSYPNSTQITLNGVTLNRGHFYRQAQFGGDISYSIQPNNDVRHTITPLSINYNHLISKTERFEEAIAENPILGLSFRNQFVTQANYLFGYERKRPTSSHGLSLQIYLAEAGNILSLFYKDKNKIGDEPNKFLGAPFAQFIKGTLELRYSYRFNNRLQLATRAYAGAVYSYGNMQTAPYTEQFYAGGANSIRGFNVRTLGPGSYTPQEENPLSFMDRTGDIRVEGNIELRYKAIGSLEIATFLDAGNVWLLHSDENRPDGVLSSKHFLNDLALGTGFGLRYDLNFLVLRFDVGLPLHYPTRDNTSYFNALQGRPQLVYHLAIGYPF